MYSESSLGINENFEVVPASELLRIPPSQMLSGMVITPDVRTKIYQLARIKPNAHVLLSEIHDFKPTNQHISNQKI